MFNTMCDVAFTVQHECVDPDDIPMDVLLDALQRRLDCLRSCCVEEAREAIGVCDSYEEEQTNE